MFSVKNELQVIFHNLSNSQRMAVAKTLVQSLLDRRELLFPYRIPRCAPIITINSNRESNHSIWACSGDTLPSNVHVVFAGVGESVLMVGRGSGNHLFGHLAQGTSCGNGAIDRVVSQVTSTIGNDGGSLDLYNFITTSNRDLNRVEFIDDLGQALSDDVSVEVRSVLLSVEAIRRRRNYVLNVQSNRLYPLRDFDQRRYEDVSGQGTWNTMNISTDE